MEVIGWRGASYPTTQIVVIVVSPPDHNHLTCAPSLAMRRRQISLLTHLPQLLLSLRVDGLVAALQELLCGQLPPNALTLAAAKVRSFSQASRAALHYTSGATRFADERFAERGALLSALLLFCPVEVCLCVDRSDGLGLMRGAVPLCLR